MYDARDDRFTNYYSLNQLYSAGKGDWQLVDETDSTGKKTGNKQYNYSINVCVKCLQCFWEDMVKKGLKWCIF